MGKISKINLRKHLVLVLIVAAGLLLFSAVSLTLLNGEIASADKLFSSTSNTITYYHNDASSLKVQGELSTGDQKDGDGISIPQATDMEFGDAPAPYPTLLEDDGARHGDSSNIGIGWYIDREAEGLPDPDALGDDNNGIDDEEGVTFPTDFIPGSSAQVHVRVSAPGYINVWIDYNADGDWADADEHVTNDHNVLGASTSWFFDTVPATAVLGDTYVRVRYSSASGLSYTGYASDGEVEDYKITIGQTVNDPPSQVVNVSPSNGATDQSLTTTELSWNAATDPESDPVTYDVYLGTTSGSPDLVSSSQTATNYTHPYFLLIYTTYYWRVDSRDDHGNVTTGIEWSFTTEDTRIHSFPWVEDFDPISGDWRNDGGDSGENWYLAIPGNGANPVQYGADYDHTYGDNAHYVAWVDDSTPHVTPTNLYTPYLNLSDLGSPQLSFWYWIGSSTSSSTLYVDIYDGFTETESVTSVASNGQWQEVTVDLTPYKSTWTRIKFRAVESTGYQSDIAIDDVSVIDVNQAPSQATNPSPSDSALDQSINSLLSWDASIDPDGDPVTYDVYFGTISGSLPNVSADQPGTTYSPGTLDYGTTYHWRVDSKDDNNKMTTGIEWSFTTAQNQPPAASAGSIPSDGETGVSAMQQVSWMPGVDPENDPLIYDLYFDTNPAPSTLVASGTSDNFYQPVLLSYNQTYYWRVDITDTAANTTTGTIWSFTTETSSEAGCPGLGILCNSSFEFGTNNWTANGDTDMLASTDAYDGLGSISSEQLRTSAQNPRWAGFSQSNISGFVAGGTYNLQLHAKGTNITQAHVKIKWYDSGATLLATTYPLTGISGTLADWTWYNRVFTVPNNAATAEFIMWHGVNASLQNVEGSILMVDRIIWQEATEYCGTVCNENFEAGLLFWAQQGKAGSNTVEIGSAKDGTRAVRSEQLYTSSEALQWTGIRQIAEVTEGQPYRLRMWFKTENAESGHVRVAWKNAQGADINTIYPITGLNGTNGTWFKQEATVTPPASATKAEIIIIHGVTQTVVPQNFEGSTIWIDNITMICDSLCNGGFENGMSDWGINGYRDVTVESTNVQEGAKAVLLLQDATNADNVQWSGINQRVQVNGGSPYELSLWLKKLSAVGGHVKVTWRDANDNFISNSFPAAGINGTDMTWAQYQSPLTAPVNADTAEIFVWHGVRLGTTNMTGSRIWVDDVSFGEILN